MAQRRHKKSHKRAPKRASLRLARLPSRGQASTTIANISYNIVLNTSGAGVASFNITTLSVTASSDWSAYAGLFWQFRVRRMRVRYVPYTLANNAAGYGAGAVATYNDDTTPGLPGGLSTVLYREDSRPAYIGKPFTLTWRPTTPDDYLFQPVAGTIVRGGMYAYLNGGPFSATIGLLFIDNDVEFTRS
jgi:hypothetical protein